MGMGNVVDTELRRPMAAFAGVSMLCVGLLTVSAGRVDAVLGVFDAPRPISVPSAPRLAPTAERPDVSVVESVPDELTVFRVGSAAADDDSGTGTGTRAPAAAPPKPQSAARGRSSEQRAAKTARKADHKAAKTALRVDHKADHKAAKTARRADHKADRKAARTARKADRQAAKAARKSDKAPRA